MHLFPAYQTCSENLKIDDCFTCALIWSLQIPGRRALRSTYSTQTEKRPDRKLLRDMSTVIIIAQILPAPTGKMTTALLMEKITHTNFFFFSIFIGFIFDL